MNSEGVNEVFFLNFLKAYEPKIRVLIPSAYLCSADIQVSHSGFRSAINDPSRLRVDETKSLSRFYF